MRVLASWQNKPLPRYEQSSPLTDRRKIANGNQSTHKTALQGDIRFRYNEELRKARRDGYYKSCYIGVGLAVTFLGMLAVHRCAEAVFGR